MRLSTADTQVCSARALPTLAYSYSIEYGWGHSPLIKSFFRGVLFMGQGFAEACDSQQQRGRLRTQGGVQLTAKVMLARRSLA